MDWADVLVVGLATAMNATLPGSGQAILAERIAGYAITETFSNAAKSAVDYTVEKGNRNIFEGTKDLDKFGEDMIVNTTGSISGGVIPMTVVKPVLQKTASTVIKKIASAAGEVALNTPRGGLTQAATKLIVGEATKKPIASPPPPPIKEKPPVPKTKDTKSKTSKKEQTLSVIRYTYPTENGEGVGDVPNNDWGRQQLKKVKDYTIIN